MKKLAMALAMLLVIATPVHAGTTSIGTNFGISHYIPERGDGLTTFGWPTASDPLFNTFAPGLRLTFGLDPEDTQSAYLDSGLLVYSISGESLTMGQFMLGYQVDLSKASFAPYLTGGLGMMVLSGGGDSVTNPVLGGGVGLRHRLAHGKGAFRFETHVDRQFEGKLHGSVVSPALTAIGLKIGFDLDLQ